LRFVVAIACRYPSHFALGQGFLFAVRPIGCDGVGWIIASFTTIEGAFADIKRGVTCFVLFLGTVCAPVCMGWTDWKGILVSWYRVLVLICTVLQRVDQGKRGKGKGKRRKEVEL